MSPVLERILVSVAGFVIGFLGSALVKKIREHNEHVESISRRVERLEEKQKETNMDFRLCMDHIDTLSKRVSKLGEKINEKAGN